MLFVIWFLSIGYLQNTKEIMEVSKKIHKGYHIHLFSLEGLQGVFLFQKPYFLCRVNEIPELFVVGKPDMTIVAFGSTVIDIFEVNDIMSSKGWHLNALQRPSRWAFSFSFYLYIYKKPRTRFQSNKIRPYK